MCVLCVFLAESTVSRYIYLKHCHWMLQLILLYTTSTKEIIRAVTDQLFNPSLLLLAAQLARFVSLRRVALVTEEEAHVRLYRVMPEATKLASGSNCAVKLVRLCAACTFDRVVKKKS